MLGVVIDLLTASTQAEYMTGLNNITRSLALFVNVGCDHGRVLTVSTQAEHMSGSA